VFKQRRKKKGIWGGNDTQFRIKLRMFLTKRRKSEVQLKGHAVFRESKEKEKVLSSIMPRPGSWEEDRVEKRMARRGKGGKSNAERERKIHQLKQLGKVKPNQR